MRHSAYDEFGQRKYLNRAENKRFVKSAGDLPLTRAAFCLTLYFTGCRISEAINLTAQDIDWEEHTIRFRSLKKRNKRHYRRVPIPASLSRNLRKIAGDEEAQIWKFCRSTGWHIVKRTMAKAQISGIHATPKGLRHGFGVRGALAGIPISLIRDWMGHADIETTAIYLNIRDEEERELIKRTWKT